MTTIDEYSRQRFRDWLRSLPQDESFCSSGRCPVAVYLGVDSITAMHVDPGLTREIDDSCLCSWPKLTPRTVLETIERHVPK